MTKFLLFRNSTGDWMNFLAGINQEGSQWVPSLSVLQLELQLSHMPPERELLAKIRQNRSALLPGLEAWRAEIQSHAEAANANPSYTLGKLLGYIGEVLRLPPMYSVEETKTPNGYYCKIILPAHCTFINEHPSETPFTAMISATSLAVGSILEACFKVDQEPETKIVKEKEKNGITDIIEENTSMTEATAKTSTPPPAMAPATQKQPTNSRPAAPVVAPPSSKKRKIREVEADDELLVTKGGSFVEMLIGKGSDGQHLIHRTHLTVNLTEFTPKSFFAALTSYMKWQVNYKSKKLENGQVELIMTVDPKDGHLPWIVSEVGLSERLAKDATVRTFYQLLTDEGIFKVNPMLPRIEDMTDYAPAQRFFNNH